MSVIGFNDARLSSGGSRSRCDHHVEKRIEDEWRKMSDWPGTPDEELLQRHVRVLGGEVRMLKGAKVVREWRHGQEVGP